MAPNYVSTYGASQYYFASSISTGIFMLAGLQPALVERFNFQPSFLMSF